MRNLEFTTFEYIVRGDEAIARKRLGNLSAIAGKVHRSASHVSKRLNEIYMNEVEHAAHITQERLRRNGFITKSYSLGSGALWMIECPVTWTTAEADAAMESMGVKIRMW